MSMNCIEKAEAIIKSKKGVLMALGKPGRGKSAVMKKIAKRNGWNYVDLRLSYKDSADIGGIPMNVVKHKNGTFSLVNSSTEFGKDSSVAMIYSIPDWALMANQKPTLINFEELNRCDIQTMRAALQPLNERMIGFDFEFGPEVYMCATGNIGDEDDCEVEELDAAMNNRLFYLYWDKEMNVEEWIEEYAKDNVIPQVISFIKERTEHLWKKDKTTDKTYTTERSWSNFSGFVQSQYGPEPRTEEVLTAVLNFGDGYLAGSTVTAFKTFLQESMRISIKDVLNRYPDIKAEIKKCKRDKISELLNSLKEEPILKMSKKQTNNVKEFLHDVDDDERVAYLKDFISNDDYVPSEDAAPIPGNAAEIVKEFRKDIEIIQANLKDYDDEEETEDDSSAVVKAKKSK